jgi:hypothetical protein
VGGGGAQQQVPVLPFIESVEVALAKGLEQPLTFHRRVMLPLRTFLPAVLHHLKIQVRSISQHRSFDVSPRTSATNLGRKVDKT